MELRQQQVSGVGHDRGQAALAGGMVPADEAVALGDLPSGRPKS